MPSVSKKRRQQPMGLLAVVVVLLMIMVVFLASEDWFSGSSNSLAASAFDAEGSLLNAVFNDDPAAIRQVIGTQRDHLSGNIAGIALMTAVSEGRGKAVIELLHDGAPVDRPSLEGRTPLILAASIPGDERIAESLLNAGADPNAVSRTGETPLTEATSFGNQTLVQLLRSHGAKPPTCVIAKNANPQRGAHNKAGA